jgi:hypothetical protein
MSQLRASLPGFVVKLISMRHRYMVFPGRNPEST